MIHHESIVAESAPEDAEEEGHWDVIEWPGEDLPFQVLDRWFGMPVADFSNLDDAVKDAERRAKAYDDHKAERAAAPCTGRM